MTTEKCQHGTSAPTVMLQALPESQGRLGRHKCAACAYKQAMREASNRISAKGRMVGCRHGKVAPKSILSSLPGNQGGSGRHKCVVCAYQEGRAKKRGLQVHEAWAPQKTTEIGFLLEVRPPKATTPKDFNEDPDRKKLIGDLGEALVLDYEKSRLLSSARPDLSNKVTHVAVVEGDSAGYDIRSFDSDGNVKYIEVKTTTLARNTAFYITENERAFGEAHASNYFIYRLFELDAKTSMAKFYIAQGNPGHSCSLQPTEYRAVPNLQKDEK